MSACSTLAKSTWPRSRSSLPGARSVPLVVRCEALQCAAPCAPCSCPPYRRTVLPPALPGTVSQKQAAGGPAAQPADRVRCCAHRGSEGESQTSRADLICPAPLCPPRLAHWRGTSANGWRRSTARRLSMCRSPSPSCRRCMQPPCAAPSPAPASFRPRLRPVSFGAGEEGGRGGHRAGHWVCVRGFAVQLLTWLCTSITTGLSLGSALQQYRIQPAASY